jgi:hypothetical protein
MICTYYLIPYSSNRSVKIFCNYLGYRSLEVCGIEGIIETLSFPFDACHLLINWRILLQELTAGYLSSRAIFAREAVKPYLLVPYTATNISIEILCDYLSHRV